MGFWRGIPVGCRFSLGGRKVPGSNPRGKRFRIGGSRVRFDELGGATIESARGLRWADLSVSQRGDMRTS